jgi:long-subunit fatty acid transport protein
MRHKAIAHALLAALSLAPAAAFAITNDELNRGLQFNFSNPGARSLGLGGAFTGLADDATASYANPAGLTILRKPEFGLEARSTDFDSSYASGGEFLLDPFDPSGVGESSSSDSVSQVSFASFVYPTERATLSVFYHRVGDFEGSVDADSIEYLDNLGPVGRIDPALGSISYQVENFGAAVGFAVSDTFSIGATIAYSDFTLSSRTTRGGFDPGTSQRQRGSDDDIVFSLGALWQITPQWNLGLAYRDGGDFSYTSSNVDEDGDLLVDLKTGFAVPDVFSAGLAFRPTDNWLFTLDVNFVEYSQLTDDVDSIFPGVVANLDVDDGTEIRFGAEYAFLEMATPMFLRAGVWLDPDHRLAYGGPTPGDCNSDADFEACTDSILFPEGDDETHFSLGVGWAFSTFVLDFAADFSDQVDTYSVSGVMRF